ncbi:MAG: glycosyltransferase family 4 protein [Verrucomicrobia bacterium]|nr:glycosyltransferase family 4 protein [Verrucomicrobiota bacterium]
MNRKRICFLSRAPIPERLEDACDGGVVNMLRMVQACVTSGAEVHVYATTRPGDLPFVWQHSANKHVMRLSPAGSRLSNPFLRYLEDAQCFAHELIEQTDFTRVQYDAIHIHHWASCVEPLTSFLRKAPRTVFTPHLLAGEKAEMLSMNLPEAVRQEEAATCQAVSCIIALSMAEKKFICRHYNIHPQRVHLVPNGVDDVFFSTPVGLQANWASRCRDSQLLCVARIAEQKGLHFLPGVIGDVRTTHSACRLAVIGGAHGEMQYERKLDGEIASAGCRKQFEFLGVQPSASIARFAERAAVYVQPSLGETQCIAILEAMAAGLPVVATRIPCISEYFRSGINGYLVERGDRKAMASAITHLLSNPDECAAISIRNRNAARNFSWQTAKDNTLACLGLHGEEWKMAA